MSSDVVSPVSAVRSRDRATTIAGVVAWPRILDSALILAAAIVILIVTRRHEPWLDEAQAWLMARDLGLKELLFHHLRYEGNPGLWHVILWVAIHVFGASYSTLPFVAAVPAIAGIAVLVFLAPFPRVIRYLSAFSYFFIYQYAVVARPYVLLALLAFLASHFYRRGLRNVFALTLSLILLSTVTVQATLIAGGLILGFAAMSFREWKNIDAGTKRDIWICVAVLGLFFGLLAFILWPPKDIIAAGLLGDESFGDHARKLLSSLNVALPFPSFLSYIPSAVLALLRISPWISGNQAIAIFFLTALGIVSHRHKTLLPFVISIISLLLFYGFVYGSPHHDGITTIAVLTALWIAAPEKISHMQSWATAKWYLTVLLLLGLSLNVQFGWAIDSMVHDYNGVYCGAPDAAGYLKTVDAEKSIVYGYDPSTGKGAVPGWVAIQPYFSDNLFANSGPRTGPTYALHSSLVPYSKGVDFAGIAKGQPDFVVIALWIPPERALMAGLERKMRELGYSVVHVSNGEMFARKYKVQDSAFIIFRRTPPKST